MAKKFNPGDKIEYFDWDQDKWVPATLDGYGEHKGEEVADVTVESTKETKWGYMDQIR